MPSIQELLIILVIVMIVFGAGKIPKIMKDMGKGIKSFKEGISEEEKEIAHNPDDNTKDDNQKNS